MSTTEQRALALMLADRLEDLLHDWIVANDAAVELRRLSAENEALRTKNDRLEELCDATYVAQGADAYNHACSEMERFQAERAKAKKEVGTTGSLCDGLEWLYGHVDNIETERDALRAQVEALTKPPGFVTLVRDVAADLGVKSLDVCAAIKGLGFGDMSVNMEVTDEIAYKVREHFAKKALTRPAVPEGWKLVPDETHRRFLVGPTPWTHTRVPQRLFDMARAVAGTSTAEDDKRVYNVLQATLQILADAPQSEVPQTAVRDIDAAAKALAQAMDYPWEHMPEQGRAQMRKDAEAILEAAAPQPEATIKDRLQVEAQPTEAAQPSLMSIINAQADEHAKRPILSEAAREKTASWCRLCGEGVVDFCRGKTGSCFVGLPMPEAAQKGGA